MMQLLLVALFFAHTVNSDRLYPYSRNSDDESYPTYQLSPIIPVRKPFAFRSYKASTDYAANSNEPRPVTSTAPRYPSYPLNSRRTLRVNSIPRTLQASPSASVPFFYRNWQANSKKASKKVFATREKPIHSPTVAKSQDTVDWSAEDMMQHPIDEAPRKSNRALGLPCSYSSDCGSGCCLLDRETKLRYCQPLAQKGDRCSKSQVKGDLYVDACPCSSGLDVCSVNNRCSW